MKISQKIILLIMGLCVICAIYFKIWKSVNSYTRVLKVNWGIELPETGVKEIFAYSTPSFHGDGIRYHVLDYPIGNENKRIQNAVFQVDKLLNGAQPTEAQIIYVEQLLEQIDVKDDVIPDWKKCSLVYLKQQGGSELFLFYRSGTGTLYIVELFI